MAEEKKSDWKSRAQKPDWKSRAIDISQEQGALETFAETAADELTLGNYPQIKAGLETAFTDEDYATRRDIERRELVGGQQAHPVASGLGTAAAIGAQMAIPAGGAIKVGQMAKAGLPIAKEVTKQIGKNFIAGSAISALKNPGDVEGEVTPIQAEERLDNVIEEAPLNAIAAATGGLIDAKGAKSAAKQSEEIVRILKPTPTKASVLLQNDAKRAREVGDFIFNRGIVKRGDSPDKIASKAQAVLDDAGTKLGNFLKESRAKLDAHKSIDDVLQGTTFLKERDLPELYSQIEEALIRRGRSGSRGAADNVIEQVMSDLDTLERSAKRASSKGEQLQLNLEGLNQMKRFMQDQVTSYDSIKDTTKDAGAMSEAYDLAAKYFSNKVDEEIAKFGDDQLSKQLKQLNREYSLAADSMGLANRYNVREFLKADPMAPLLTGFGTSGAVLAATGEPMLAAGTGLATGLATKAVQGVSPTTKSAIKREIPEYLSRNIIPKASAVYAAQEQTPVFPPTPFEQQEQIRRDHNLKNTEKAKMLQEVRRNK